MAYEKQTWECGESITAEKLNHMEDGIANAGEGGTGYECTSKATWGILTESVTTTELAPGVYIGELSQSVEDNWLTIDVILDGVKYEGVTANEDGTYGGTVNSRLVPDYSEYPFIIQGNSIAIETSGTHTIAVEGFAYHSIAEPCLESAIANVLAKRIKHKLLLLLVSEAVTINPGQHGRLKLSLADGYTVPDNVIGFGVTEVESDLNHLQLQLHGFTLSGYGDTASIYVYNSGSAAVTINPGNQTQYTIEVSVTYIDMPRGYTPSN